jgi:CRISPR-associated exonuclease Cas4
MENNTNNFYQTFYDIINAKNANISIPLTAEEIRQHHFCPRILYFRRVFNILRRETFLMHKGIDYHDRIVKRIRDNVSHSHKIYYNFRVNDEVLKLNVSADIVIIKNILNHTEEPDTGHSDTIRNSVIDVYEVKRFGNKDYVHEGQIYQLLLTGLLVSNYLKFPINKLILQFYNGEQYKFIPNDLLVKQLAELIIEIRKMIHNQEIPTGTSNLNKCNTCDYRNVCFKV